MDLVTRVKEAIEKRSASSKFSAIFKQLAATGTHVTPKGPGKSTQLPKVPQPKMPKAPRGPKAPSVAKPKNSSIPYSMDPTDLRPGGIKENMPMSFGQMLTQSE